MGISSVNNPDAKIEVVPDCEQRAGTPRYPQLEVTPLTYLQNISKNPPPTPKNEPLITRRCVTASYPLTMIDPLILTLRVEGYGRDRQCQNGKGRPIYRLNIALCTIPDVRMCV